MWLSFVKPNFERHVDPQRKLAGALDVTDRMLKLTKTAA